MEKILERPGFEPILEKIFKLLNQDTLLSCLLVNKYWNNVVQNPTFWLTQLKLAKMPEEILQKWKELANKVQDNDQLSKMVSKCMIRVLKSNEKYGFPSPVMAASKHGLVPILKFMATYTKMDFQKVENDKNSKKDLSGIYWGVYSGKVEIVKYFHQLGYNLDIPIYNDWTPFFLAIWRSHLEIIKFLASVLKNPLSKPSKLWHGGTAFHVAAGYGRHESLKCLLKIKNDPDFVNKSSNGTTPLHLAAQNGHLECVKILTSFGSSLVNEPMHVTNNYSLENKNNYTALQLAVEYGHAEVVEYLAKFVDNPNQNLPFPNPPRSTPLKIALSKNDSKMVKVLLKILCEKMDSNPQKIMRSLKGLPIPLLSRPNPNPNQNLPIPNPTRSTPLKMALSNNDSKMVKVLLKELYTKMDSNPQEVMSTLKLLN